MKSYEVWRLIDTLTFLIEEAIIYEYVIEDTRVFATSSTTDELTRINILDHFLPSIQWRIDPFDLMVTFE